MELNKLSIQEFHEGIKAKKFSIEDVVRAVLNSICDNEPTINAYISVFEDEALNRAKELDSKLTEDIPPLYGVPIAVKDNINFRGHETTCASKILKGYISPYNATVVERLLKQNAIIIGKTNMDEFAMGSSGEYSAFGPTRNPINPEYVPGGSSSGSAAAVAAGEAIAALGSDTGGSIRLPASYCGLVGFKPTYGMVSRYGLVAFASSLDQIGPITRNVSDAAILFEAIGGFDPHDSTSVQKDVPSAASLFEGLSDVKLRIGIPKEYFSEGLDPDVAAVIENALKQLEANGHKLIELSLPHVKYAIETYYLIAMSEASSNLARYDGVRYGFRRSRDELDEMYKATRTEGFGPEVKRRIMIGTFALSAGYYDAYYLTATKVRRLIKMDFEKAFEDVDVIVGPTSPVPPFKLGERLTDPILLYLVDIYTVTVNLAGLPAISIPCGTTNDGLPIGLQLIGRAFGDGELLRAARIAEMQLSLNSFPHF